MPQISEFYQSITKTASTVLLDDSIDAIIKKIVNRDPVNRSVYVVNEQAKLFGIITLKELFQILAVRGGVDRCKSYSPGRLLEWVSPTSTANDLMRSPVSVKLTDSLEYALELFVKHDLEEIPVVNENGIVIGDLDAFEIIRAMND
ncbi:CBS domain-containing protein [Alkalihalobacterium chitinilyticum]|uniref:CBS domain-containing protein n=1 Tax=Alkalihalobacterium chitinilyticum TaxID=2980103 RepID=A0ABT5VMY9_9BACI|nr:CBS domain-containing protein [Alkalihalobacterium chitinilyticum]MDE5415634.1 CBS domain-containing protein [Alkalihalobacterium chitinilyticum]